MCLVCGKIFLPVLQGKLGTAFLERKQKNSWGGGERKALSICFKNQGLRKTYLLPDYMTQDNLPPRATSSFTFKDRLERQAGKDSPLLQRLQNESWKAERGDYTSRKALRIPCAKQTWDLVAPLTPRLSPTNRRAQEGMSTNKEACGPRDTSQGNKPQIRDSNNFSCKCCLQIQEKHRAANHKGTDRLQGGKRAQGSSSK